MDDVNNSVLAEIARLARLVAVLGVDGKSQREQIRVLNLAGFSPKEIAEIIGTTGNTVRVSLTNIRKNNGRKRKGKRE